MQDLIAATPQAFCLECGTPPEHPAHELWVRTGEGDLCQECAELLGLIPPDPWRQDPSTPAA